MDSKIPSKSRKINLIPSELAVPSEFVKVTKILNRITIIIASLLLIFVIVIFGLFYSFNTSIVRADQINTDLKNRISALETSEQKLVLAKDRISKIKYVQDSKSLGDEIGRFKSFISVVASNPAVLITEASLSSSGTEVTVLAKTTEDLKLFLEPLSTISVYQRIIVTSLGYSSANGYVLNVDLINKEAE